MGAPLFGYKPCRVQPEQIFEDCVSDYATSMSRRFIWDGIKQIVARSLAIQELSGDLHVDSEFVEVVAEPTHAALCFESKGAVTRQLLELWRQHNVPDWMVETYLLPPKPTEPSLHEAWDIYKAELAAQFTDYGRKGHAIVDFISCHAFTKS